MRRIFDAALAAALPEGKFDGKLPPPPVGRTIVLGAGKAAASMAAAFEAAWEHPCEGLVITRYRHGTPTRHIEVVEAGHPIPDLSGHAAATRIMDLARSAGPDDLVVCLVSGGASALLSLPADGVTLDDKRRINRELLASGAPIGQINSVRRSMSAIKGGRLAALVAPARLVTYLISDVPGDAPHDIGSGPTFSTASNPKRALDLLDGYAIATHVDLRQAILRNVVELCGAPPVWHMLATPVDALAAAARCVEGLGYRAIMLGDAIEGEAREVGRAFAAIASYHADQSARSGPVALISGGETTVTVRGTGRGGRNTEFLLGLVAQLGQRRGISALACDTDGIDGIEDNAGAWIDLGAISNDDDQSIARHLANNDSYAYFAAQDRLIMTGPTRTNVNDFRLVLIEA
ncbi:glycerate kinase type-2 family protein [Devosia sp. A449]